MSRKFVSVIVAIAIMASMSITVFADPADTTAPAGSAAPTESVNPAGSPAPVAGNDEDVNTLTAQVKTMREQVKALRAQLQSEKQLDQQMRAQIRSLKKIATPDANQIKAYETDLKPLTAKLKELTKELKKEENKKGKKRDETKIAELKNQINDVKTAIEAVNAKYKDLQGQIDTNKNAHIQLKELRKKLQPMYASLRTKINEAKALNKEIDKLVIGLKAALQVNDAGKATDVVKQVLARMDALKLNIARRIAIREQMLDTMKSCAS